MRAMEKITPKTLAEVREKMGLTRGELAALCGVAETTIWRIETGRNQLSQLETWQRIVDAIQAARNNARV